MKLSHLSSRRQLQGLKKKVLASLTTVLEQYHVVISKRALDDTTNRAEVDVVDRELVINPENETLDDFVYTVVHEVLHILSPETPEQTIERLEIQLKDLLTPSDMTVIFRTAAMYVEWEELLHDAK